MITQVTSDCRCEIDNILCYAECVLRDVLHRPAYPGQGVKTVLQGYDGEEGYCAIFKPAWVYNIEVKVVTTEGLFTN